MNYRNPVYNRFGTIDVEIEHELLGWIPFTASPDDPQEWGRTIYEHASKGEVAEYVAPEPIIIPEPTLEEKLASIGITKQELLDLLRSE